MGKQSGIKAERVGYLDIMKCLGMFIIVSGHIHNEYGWFSLPLHAFAIPMFFFLSGMTFRRTKYPKVMDLVKRRSKTLLLPYVIFGLLTWAVWAVFSIATHRHTDIVSPLLQLFIAQGSAEFITFNPPLWFITCLFIVEVLYYFIDKLPQWASISVCVVLAALGHWMVKGPYNETFRLLPWNIEGAMTAMLFYCTGNVLTKHFSLKEIETRINSARPLAIVLILVITTALVFISHWNGHVSIGSNLLGKSTVVYYISAYMGILTIALFSVLFCSLEGWKQWLNRIICFCKWFGRKSYWIMATHVPVKNFFIFGIAAYLGTDIRFVRNDLFWCAVIFTLTCAICCGFCLIIERVKRRDEAWVEKCRENKVQKSING